MVGQSNGILLAPAKINFCLHVGAKRSDSLHDLQSLVFFAGIGDRISVCASDTLDLKITGPFANVLASVDPADNLVLKATRLLQQKTGIRQGASITLEKNLPIASGAGGGTADAAATLMLLRDLYAAEISEQALESIAFEVGADGPVCLHPHFHNGSMAIMAGAGESVAVGPSLPDLWVCLVNPGKAVSTEQVFQALADTPRQNPDCALPNFPMDLSKEQVSSLLRETRNDLEKFAEKKVSAIGRLRESLKETKGCLGARMSGSGATVFGLFGDADDAQKAATDMQSQSVWAVAAKILN